MRSYTAKEAARFFRSCGTECEESTVEKWIVDTPTIGRDNPVDECDLIAFNDWLRSKGTSYEPGIDDQTKITRLLEENSTLRKEIESLREEIFKLATNPDYKPF